MTKEVTRLMRCRFMGKISPVNANDRVLGFYCEPTRWTTTKVSHRLFCQL